MVMYADDSSLIITADTLQQLEQKCQTTMIKLNKYLSSNNLFLNEKKTVYMVFDNIDIHISYNNIQIKKVDKFKLLGVTLDNCFKFDTHVYNIIRKINSLYGFFGNITRQKIPYKVKLIIFNSFIRSHIIYSATYLNSLNRTNTNKLFKTLNKIYKYIFNIRINKQYLTDLTDFYIKKFVNNILERKKPTQSYSIFKKHLSSRKQKYFLLYKKPKIKLTFFYNLISSFNRLFKER